MFVCLFFVERFESEGNAVILAAANTNIKDDFGSYFFLLQNISAWFYRLNFKTVINVQFFQLLT